jgi:peptidoglycan/LPS O-acetylase OafA/YrhL
MQKRINTFEALRTIFILMVFTHHFLLVFANRILRCPLYQAGGYCAVTFFFMLSGFVMSIGYGNKVCQSSFSYRSYIAGRLIRIYPLHLFCLVLALFTYVYTNHLGGLPLSWGDMKIYFFNALLLQTWIPLRTVYYGCNDVAWFLADTLFFYALFPVVVRVVNKLSGRRLLSVVIIILAVYYLTLPFVPMRNAHWIIYICPLIRFLDFAWGIVLYRLFSWVEKSNFIIKFNIMSVKAKTLIELLALLLVAVTLQLYGILPEKWGAVSLYWPAMFVLIFVFAVSGRYGGGLVSRLFENKLFYRLGALSFTFYMIHFMVIRVLNTLMLQANIRLSLSLQLLLSMLIAWTGAYIINRYYEKPVTNYLKSKIK